ncbi:MAG: GGDEF domain-containing protein [Armatimonadota bacterium]|nr:GGDEF domain-containing protein [Armatimonadota bacterium]MDR7404201.1 GGDEF domain-containing protein [Armatimonadota bacterium]
MAPRGHVVTAVVLITIGVQGTGGVRGPFVWGYSVAAAVEAMLRGLRWGMAVATLCSAFLVAGAALGQAGWFASVRVTADAPVGAYLVSYIGLFYTIVLVAAALRVQVLEIARLARTDSLTGLGNLRALRQVLEREQAAAPEAPLSLLMVELDGFKAVNDRCGPAGCRRSRHVSGQGRWRRPRGPDTGVTPAPGRRA